MYTRNELLNKVRYTEGRIEFYENACIKYPNKVWYRESLNKFKSRFDELQLELDKLSKCD